MAGAHADPDVPADLEAVVMKCLAKAPRDRYTSVDQLDAALVACADAGRWTQRDAQSWWLERRSGAPRQPVT